VKLRDIISGTTWFIAMDLLTLVILIAFPAISLFLPSLMAQ
jgi:TRAP-type C4-dicarboxylate transport system permease large subunit